ncbi:hypothetical protein FRC01_004848 [Tulasnella sp. 417]|nr:hypothetical protein FRC01_004848 [Tulasnella sp. 417]
MPTRPSITIPPLGTREDPIDIRSPTDSEVSVQSTPSEFGSWGNDAKTTQSRTPVAPPVKRGPPSAAQPSAPVRIAGPSNPQLPYDQTSETLSQQLNEQSAAAIEATERLRKRINLSVVVGGKIILNARQKLTRAKMFDLEMSEAKGGMIFDYDDSDMMLGLLCRIHDSKQIQGRSEPTLIVVPSEGHFDKWTRAAQDLSDKFRGNTLIYRGRERTSSKRF